MKNKQETPTPNQIKFAKELGIKTTSKISKSEMSVLIDEELVKKSDITDADKKIADRYKIEYSKHTTRRELFNKIKKALNIKNRELELIEWFLYCVYSDQKKTINNIDIKGPEDPLIKEIASELYKDSAIIKSARRYKGTELLKFGVNNSDTDYSHVTGSKETKAYKAAIHALKKTSSTKKIINVSRRKKDFLIYGFIIISALVISYLTWNYK